MEDSIAALSPYFAAPISAALKDAELSLDDLASVIFFGGNTRVPMVQTAVKTILGDKHSDKIAQNVNTDEAAVLGAAYYGAGLSKLFKMKSLNVIEKATEDITMNGEVLFSKGTKLGERKTVSLPIKDDFELEFAQAG